MSSSGALNDDVGNPQCLLQVDDLNVTLGGKSILKSISFRLPIGRTMVVLGESGCGKTTLLKALAGLLPVSFGTIRLEGRSLAGIPPAGRGMVYLDQEPLLFEHLNVTENVAFAMRMRREPEDRIQAAVCDLLAAMDLSDHATKRDGQLSGGQKQRVAFARAVLAGPRILLLDEPFGSLDGRTRRQMQDLFAGISRRHSLTSVFVTHDVKEALIVGQQFARISHGQLLLYRDRDEFIQDEATGIPGEIDFWRNQDQRG